MATKGTAPQHLDPEERNAVILEHYPLVQRLARRLAKNLGTPTGVEVTDLVNHGVIGLVEAWERFDPDRGVAFNTFAIPRIKGAIVDAIRHSDWVPRKVRARARKVADATNGLTTQLGRAPTHEEIVDQLGQDPFSGRKRMPATLIALEDAAVRGGGGSSVAIADTLADEDVEAPGSGIEDAETCALLGECVNTLPERDRLILTLHYFEGVQLTDIARVLGVTESRVSQLHTRALGMLRLQLAEAV